MLFRNVLLEMYIKKQRTRRLTGCTVFVQLVLLKVHLNGVRAVYSFAPDCREIIDKVTDKGLGLIGCLALIASVPIITDYKINSV